MKNFSLVLILFCFAVSSTLAQRTITGTVTDSEGETLIGANILIKGTSIGTVTDIDGNYSFEIPDGTQTLIFSYTGFTSQEVVTGVSNIIDVTLMGGVMLNEAIVTALGITREKKALSYAAQEVQQKELNITRTSNFADALTGKVAGVQLVGTPSSTFREGNLRIRGVNGLNGSAPLYVLDGTPVSASAINMDNIESVSVLKGPAATALYGNRAAGGVVIATSKKGAKGQGLGIEINSATAFDNVYLLPDYQNEYAGGYTGDFDKFEYNPAIHPADWASFDGQNTLEYYADESWGPKMDGRMYRPYYSWFPGDDYGKQVPLNPQPDNIKNFFNTGRTLNNNIAFTGGADNYSFRVNFNNIDRELVLPNTKQVKNILSVIGSFDLSKKISVHANINYKNTDQQGRVLERYGGYSSNFNQWFQRQLDIDKLKNYKNADGSFRSWNMNSPLDPTPLYWDNPYYEVYENVPHYNENRLYGNVGLTFNLMDNLKVQGFIRTDLQDWKGDSRFTEGGLGQASFNTYNGIQSELNYEALISYNNRIGDLSYDFNLGGNIRKNNRDTYSASTVGGLAIPGFYNINSSKDKPNIGIATSTKEVRSIYGRGSFGYKGMLYLDFSIRNDWSSALPADNNSYLYPMAGLSFVFSELIPNNSFFSYGKVRYSFAQVGSDIGAHSINPIYGANPASFYGSLPTMNLPNTLRNQVLEPQLTSTHEAGIEMKFLNARLGLDLTYYKDNNENQILNLTVPATSGYTTAIINAGNISREGWEVQLTGNPVRTSDFRWDVTLNWATNKSVVEELADGLDTRSLGTISWGGASIHARAGEEWGTLVGRKFRRDDNGNILVRENGRPFYDNGQVVGSILPNFTGGLINSLVYKGINLGISIDFQDGGLYHSYTEMFNGYSGLSPATIGLNDKGNNMRDPVSEGGGLRHDANFEDGTPNDVYLSARSHFTSQFGILERWTYDASYFKLREISLGYDFDTSKLGINKYVKGLRVSLIGRNIAVFGTSVDWIDPSEMERIWGEGGQLPSTRTVGFNVSLKL